MDNGDALAYLHRHYIAWLMQGQWEPELSLPRGFYPTQGEWLRIEWRFTEPLNREKWGMAEEEVQNCFGNICEVWVSCRDKQVSALAMAKTLSGSENHTGLWVACIYAAEELQHLSGEPVACFISECCQSYSALPDVTFVDLNTWWTRDCALTLQERRTHRRKIQNYLKKGQYGHISGYASRCLKRGEGSESAFWYWIPLVMESLWLQERPPMASLVEHLDMKRLALEGSEGMITWIRKTCASFKITATPDDPIKRVTDSIRRDCSLPYSQANLAEGLGLTPAYFCRLFEKRTGIRFSAYLTHARITHAQELLRGDASLAEITLASGFQRKSYFCEVFRKQTGMTALAYRAKWKEREAQ